MKKRLIDYLSQLGGRAGWKTPKQEELFFSDHSQKPAIGSFSSDAHKMRSRRGDFDDPAPITSAFGSS